ncbi:MAG: serine hydrolase [Candidatus Riflebacteria bacterium]|nr:serine hydrolase [Candidatus Riflebacteria bacterium]
MIRSMILITTFLALILFPASAVVSLSQADIEKELASVLAKHDVPALGGAIVTSDGIAAIGVAGVRKRGTEVKVTASDLWHLGSNTKAMTALLAGLLVQKNLISWDVTVEKIFPELKPDLNSQFAGVTLLQLLSHHAGLKANCSEWNEAISGNPQQQRYETIKFAMSESPENVPGTTYAYSNAGYVIAAAMLEKATGKSWEELISAYIFRPLEINDSGFGGIGTPGTIDQPWPHTEDGNPLPKNGPEMDNPVVMSPAGRVNMSLYSWGLFVADFLRGLQEKKSIASSSLYKTLTTIPFSGDYALGWLVSSRPWGGGNVFTHAGSNTFNYCVVWMAPLKDFAILITCNQGGSAAEKACDEATSRLIQLLNLSNPK